MLFLSIFEPLLDLSPKPFLEDRSPLDDWWLPDLGFDMYPLFVTALLKNRVNRGTRTGRQAQVMAMSSSMIVHI